MNRVILIGRLTKDPETRYSQGANPTAVSRYTLAVGRRFKRDGEQSTDFINCIAFGKSAEFAEKYLKKGMMIAVEGHWQTGSYKNKDGQTVYTNDCVIDNQEFAESKAKNETAPQPSASVPGMDGFMSIPDSYDEGLPFN